jgi:hypothetical protein
MNKSKFFLSAFVAISGILSLNAQVFWDELEKNYDPIIVVTALKFTSDTPPLTMDLSVGEGAIVKVASSGKNVGEKTTEAFSLPFSNGETFFTADFQIKLDSVYNISITLKDGSSITIDDYKIKSNWKTHHYIHSTDGTKHPSAVLRKEQDEKTGTWFFIYSLYPLRQYQLMGGTQIK